MVFYQNTKVLGWRIFWMALTLAGLFVFWVSIANCVAKPFLPGPLLAFQRFGDLCQHGNLLLHTLVSARRVVQAILVSIVPALSLGLAAGRSRRGDAIVSPVIYLIHPLPKIAFLPLVMLFFGLDDPSKVIIIALVVFSQLVFSARDAAKRTPEALIDAVRSVGGGRWATLIHVIFPYVLPEIFTALRISLGSGIAVLFFSETFATSEGLGWFVMDAWTRVNYPDMYAAIIALGLFGLASYVILDILEWVVCRWKR